MLLKYKDFRPVADLHLQISNTVHMIFIFMDIYLDKSGRGNLFLSGWINGEYEVAIDYIAIWNFSFMMSQQSTYRKCFSGAY